MKRIEPTLCDIDEVLQADASGGRSLTRTPESASDRVWITFASLLTLLSVITPYALLHSGRIGNAVGESASILVPKSLVLGGIAILWSIYLLGIVALFSRSFTRGVLSLLLPGHWFFALPREGLWLSFVGFTYLGFAFWVLGALHLA